MNDEYADRKAITKGKDKRETSHPAPGTFHIDPAVVTSECNRAEFPAGVNSEYITPGAAVGGKDNPGLSWK
jgi:hypothetical protein